MTFSRVTVRAGSTRLSYNNSAVERYRWRRDEKDGLCHADTRGQQVACYRARCMRIRHHAHDKLSRPVCYLRERFHGNLLSSGILVIFQCVYHNEDNLSPSVFIYDSRIFSKTEIVQYYHTHILKLLVNTSKQ